MSEAIHRVRGALRNNAEARDLAMAMTAAPLRCDIYLAYSGSPQLHFDGFLVCEKDNIDRPIAYCPIGVELEPHSAPWRQELIRQLRIACRVADFPSTAEDNPEVVYLGWVSRQERPVPHWLYGMSCIPLKRRWDGMFVHPRPCCPELLEHMASQLSVLRGKEQEADAQMSEPALAQPA